MNTKLSRCHFFYGAVLFIPVIFIQHTSSLWDRKIDRQTDRQTDREIDIDSLNYLNTWAAQRLAKGKERGREKREESLTSLTRLSCTNQTSPSRFESRFLFYRIQKGLN